MTRCLEAVVMDDKKRSADPGLLIVTSMQTKLCTLNSMPYL